MTPEERGIEVIQNWLASCQREFGDVPVVCPRDQIELAKIIASALRVPEGYLRNCHGQDYYITCVSHAGAASAPGKWYDGEPMQDARLVAALSAKEKA